MPKDEAEVTLYDSRSWLEEGGYVWCYSTQYHSYYDHNLTLSDGSKIINFYDHKDATDMRLLLSDLIDELTRYRSFLRETELGTS